MTSNDPTGTLEELFDSERAVSPVIGVILMVAITVILAAVIGTFVLGLGQDAATDTPQPSLSMSASGSGDGTVTIEHRGGDALHSDRTRVVINADSEVTYDPTSDANDGTFSVGNSITFDGSDESVGSPWDSYSTSDDLTVSSGDAISIQLIDTENQQIIYENEVTAS